MPTRIVLIRHGQTASNVADRVRGQIDVPLDETGLWQAQQTAAYVAARWPVQAVYASPMGRAMATAGAVAAAQGLAAQPMDGLLDLDFGEWGGMLTSEVKTRWPELHDAWFNAPHTVRFPGGEGLDEVRARAAAALEGVVARHAGEAVAMVAHTVVNRVIMCAVLGLGNEHFWQLGQGTCAVNVIDWEAGRYFLMVMNDTSHLWRAGDRGAT
ncbi:MAG: histidine phosphatase family protein [Anaerolineae bacterium]|nr:histidine phosphatase family protein [Anaerolineae bacterium]